MPIESILTGYAADAANLISLFEALSTEEVLAPVLDLLPSASSRILEVGAGTGRDAAWLAARGHHVTAVEPVEALRRAGMALHPEPDWTDDRLPGLERVCALGEHYDLVLLVAVWQHLPPEQHRTGIAALAGLIAPAGRLILSLRHGPGSPSRPCFPTNPEAIVADAAEAGLRLVRRVAAPSIQQQNRDAGVTWTWLCLERC